MGCLQMGQAFADFGRELTESIHFTVQALLTSQRFDGVVIVIADSAQGATYLLNWSRTVPTRLVNTASFLLVSPASAILGSILPRFGNGRRIGIQVVSGASQK